MTGWSKRLTRGVHPADEALLRDAHTAIVLDRSRAVIQVDEEKVRFVNAALATFLVFVRLGHQYCGNVRKSETPDAVVESTVRAMRTADPRAFRDRDAFWPLIVEQMRAGLL